MHLAYSTPARLHGCALRFNPGPTRGEGDLELIAASRPVLSRRPYIPRAAWSLQPSRAVPVEAGLRGAAPRENLLSAPFISQGLGCFGCHLWCSPAWICTRTGVLACHVIQHAAHLTSGYQQHEVAVAVKSTHAELFSRCPPCAQLSHHAGPVALSAAMRTVVHSSDGTHHGEPVPPQHRPSAQLPCTEHNT